ncbi:hypothetical protein E4U53_003515 [Claviceps sorghi]|nr:hypothetical protein E4U53_003515 [Claviceps sorghi]
MASHQPVPSRAALNALRGVILTTSCSVILLAEERRRRLQIARAAIDNARKLHSVQINRGPVALAECHGTWNGRFAEADDDTLSLASLPRPRTSTRRRDRSQMIGHHQPAEVCEHQSQPQQPVSRAESYDENTEPSRATHFLGNGLSMVSSNKLNLTSFRSNRPQIARWKTQRRGPRPKFSNHAASFAVSNTNSIGNEVHIAVAGINSSDTMAADKPCSNIRPIEAAQQYLQKTAQGNQVSSPSYDDVMPILEQLLTELETSTTHGDLHLEILNVARTIFERIACFGPLPKAAQPIRFQAIRLFHIVAHSRPQDIAATLSSMLPLSKYPLALLEPFIRILLNSDHREARREVFLLLSHDSTLCSWQHGKLVYRLLARLAQSRQGFGPTKQLYTEFQQFGLFSQIEVSKAMEYKIRRMMIILALQAEENDFAITEFRKLEEVDLDASLCDIRLQRYIIMKKASSGKWDQVWPCVDMLRQKVDPRCVELQTLLSKVTDIFVNQHRDHDQLEAFLRQTVTDLNLSLKSRWVYAVLDQHASRRQADSAISWLRFCGEHGRWTDTIFNQRFLARCRKFWSFSEKAIRRFAILLYGYGVTSKQSSDPNPGAVCNRHATPTSSLKQAVLEQLHDETPNLQRARQLIAQAHKEGHDISEALPLLLIAQFEQGDDPRQLVHNALQLGVRLHNSTYNKAAQALSAVGNHKAAAEMCEIAARENGNGQLLYSEYNFANLVYAYTGAANYAALQSVLSEFTSEAQWWHGSPTCKETIKLAMKATAVRAVADAENSEPHRQALDHLDIALLHVKECRPTKEERLAVSDTFVRFVKAPSRKASRKAHGQFRTRKSSDAARQQCVPAALEAARTPVDPVDPDAIDHAVLAAASRPA